MLYQTLLSTRFYKYTYIQYNLQTLVYLEKQHIYTVTSINSYKCC